MKNTFGNRVATERRVLTAINRRLGRDQQLAGLSRPAIYLWAAGMNRNLGDKFVQRLLEIGELCQSLSDRSHETFIPLSPARVHKLEEVIGCLESEAETLSDAG